MKIDFEVETKYGTYRDVIHTPVELTQEQIEAIKNERVNNWIAVIEAPPPPEPLPPEGFEFVRDEYGMIQYHENGEPVLAAVGEE
jgi:hypothetical protein